MKTALEGLKVLDVSFYGPVPFCTMILGDLGAEIIRVEGAQWELDVAEFPAIDSPFDPLNRNKKSISINLKTEEGKNIFHRLAERADIVVEGFRPGVTKRLGIDYETLKLINPSLIYCSVTGYGQSGPYRDLVGHDINYIAQGGVLGIMCRPDVLPGNIIADVAAGGMQAAIGILSAIVARQSSGKGQYIDISVTDGVIYMVSHYIAKYLETGTMPRDEERTTVGATPYYNVFRTKDDKHITIASAEPKFFSNLCRILGCEDFIPYDSSRASEIRLFFEKTFLSRTRDEWFKILSKSDTAVGKVLSVAELISDPQVLHRKMIEQLDHPDLGKVRQPGIPIKLSDTPGKIRKFSPKPGENTAEVLAGLGYNQDTLEKLKKSGVISMPETEKQEKETIGD